MGILHLFFLLPKYNLREWMCHIWSGQWWNRQQWSIWDSVPCSSSQMQDSAPGSLIWRHVCFCARWRKVSANIWGHLICSAGGADCTGFCDITLQTLLYFTVPSVYLRHSVMSLTVICLWFNMIRSQSRSTAVRWWGVIKVALWNANNPWVPYR